MKIINTSRPSPDDRLAQEIKNLETKVGLTRIDRGDMPKHVQRAYLLILQEFVEYYFAVYSEEPKVIEQNCAASSFPKFSSLPVELRLSIFEFAFASDLEPKIHCIDERRSTSAKKGARFMSNQPISPLLHLCRESRAHYLLNTKACFAFETYIRFPVDTIYIPDFFSRKKQFPRFLDCASAVKIEKLAMRKDFYCDLPGPDHFSEKHVDMLFALPRWKEMSIVFDDYKTRTEVWEEGQDLTFRDLSAKEKRSGPGSCERGYARQWAFHLNNYGHRHINYRYVVPNYAEKSTKGHLNIIF